nr:hypothetical protein [Tanacetum cinerariifolium]
DLEKAVDIMRMMNEARDRVAEEPEFIKAIRKLLPFKNKRHLEVFVYKMDCGK